MAEQKLRDYATAAIKYWEPRRILYNLLLVTVVALTFSLNFGQAKAAFNIDSVLWLFLLAMLANVAYCAAYIVDIFVQASAFRDQWTQFRWMLFALGAAFAAVLARYFSLALFGITGVAWS
jgi:hypothetical protein